MLRRQITKFGTTETQTILCASKNVLDHLSMVGPDVLIIITLTSFSLANWFGYVISLTYIEPVEECLLRSRSILRLVLQTKPNADLVVQDECPNETKNQLQVTTNYISTTWRLMCMCMYAWRERERKNYVAGSPSIQLSLNTQIQPTNLPILTRRILSFLVIKSKHNCTFSIFCAWIRGFLL